MCTMAFLSIDHAALGQNPPIFSWRSHFSYQSIIDIAQSQDRVYAAAPNALFYVDKAELSVHKITKIDGLSDVGIGAIGVAPGTNTLVIGYTNGNIDLLEGNNITNLPAFRDATVIGGKIIRDIKFNAGLAYLASDQGILVIDLDSKQITESYQNLDNGDREAITGIAFTADSIYASSQSGIFSASLSSNTNRQDFNNWQQALPQIPFALIAGNGTDLVASGSQTIYEYENGQWSQSLMLSEIITDFDYSTSLLVLTNTGLYRIENGNSVRLLNLQDSEGTARVFLPEGTRYWVGDGLNGLRRFSGSDSESFSPNGPVSDISWRISQDLGSIHVVQGGYSEAGNTLGREGILSRFVDNAGWQTFPITLGANNDVFDLVDIELTSENPPVFYLASFDRGLFSFEAPDVISAISETSPNSSLQSTGGSVNMTAIAREGDALWMTIFGTSTPLHRWDPATDTWTPYNLRTSLADFPVDLYVAPNGDKWMPIDPERGGGIVVFNENGQRERYLNTNGGQGGLPGPQVTSLALDDDFFLWVGTNEGIAFFPNLNSILEGVSLTASVPIFENRLLLRDEFITSIAIDPGNRKWFGTQNNGLWLFSETGEEQIFHFTAENSPLPSNQITSLTINPTSGELFIGTDKGTVSFRSDATEGTDVHQTVSIYPNPAMKNSLDRIVIEGLVNNALVKITDITGKLVKELRAQGSTALWNGRNVKGQAVATGVYLVYSSNADGTETYVGKIAII